MAKAPKSGAPGSGDPLALAKRRWSLGAALVAWLAGIIAPAISFDIGLAMSSDAGIQFQAFFQILATVLFLLAWRSLDKLPLWSLGVLALVSVALFVTYSIAKDPWTCVYLDDARYVTGNPLKPEAESYLRKEQLLSAPCAEQMSHFGGDGLLMWPRTSLVVRFLSLFGLYSLAWLSLALLIAGAVRRGIDQFKPMS